MHRIESLIPDQWSRLKRVRLEALRDTPDAFGSTYEQQSKFDESDWRQRLERDDCRTFVALLGDDNPVGLVVGAPYDSQAGLFAMWVSPHYRGKGTGGDLVDIVIEWARKRGFSNILLDVADDNMPAIALYESKGFIQTGIKGTLPPPRDRITEHQRMLPLLEK